MLFMRLLLLIEQLVLLMSTLYNLKISFDLMDQVYSKSTEYVKWTGLDLHRLSLTTFIVSSCLIIHIAWAIVCTLKKRWNFILKYQAIGYSIFSLAYANIVFLYFCTLINFIGICRTFENSDKTPYAAGPLTNSKMSKFIMAARCIFDKNSEDCVGPSTEYFNEIRDIILKYATQVVISLLIQVGVSALVTAFCYCLYKYDCKERVEIDTRIGEMKLVREEKEKFANLKKSKRAPKPKIGDV